MSRFPSEWEQRAEFDSRWGVGAWDKRKALSNNAAAQDGRSSKILNEQPTSPVVVPIGSDGEELEEYSIDAFPPKPTSPTEEVEALLVAAEQHDPSPYSAQHKPLVDLALSLAKRLEEEYRNKWSWKNRAEELQRQLDGADRLNGRLVQRAEAAAPLAPDLPAGWTDVEEAALSGSLPDGLASKRNGAVQEVREFYDLCDGLPDDVYDFMLSLARRLDSMTQARDLAADSFLAEKERAEELQTNYERAEGELHEAKAALYDSEQRVRELEKCLQLKS